MATAAQKEHPSFAEVNATRTPMSHEADDPRDAIHDDDDWEHVMRTKAPPAREGFAQRWVRMMTAGVEDTANIMKKRNEGWSPRNADTIPTGFFAPIIAHASFGNCIVNGDMILMERPMRVHEKQRRHNAKMASLQASTIERYLERNAPGGRGFSAAEVEKFERTVSTGRRPKIADD
jgi:hypothetical protein